MQFPSRIPHPASRILRYALRFTLYISLLTACGEIVEPQATAPTAGATAQPQGQERLQNSNFAQDLSGWTISKPESDAVQSVDPVASADYAYNGAGKGVRFDTAPGVASISALEQEFTPTSAFTLSFVVRPQRGSSRIGISADGTRSNVNVSRLVFIDAGEPTAAIVVTAWDMNYVLRMPVAIDTWLPVTLTVDSSTGSQVLHVGDSQPITLDVLQANRPVGKAIVLGDRQPRSDAYTIPLTNIQVKDGLNGSYDYANISLLAKP